MGGVALSAINTEDTKKHASFDFEPALRDAGLHQLCSEGLISLALYGLRKIAFGSAADAVSLALCEESPSSGELAAMDLFLISEIKRPKAGSCEIKFYDRMQAMELLARYGESRKNGQTSNFLEALRGISAETGE